MSQPRSDTPHGQGLALADWLMACHEERAHPIYRDERFKQAAVEIRYAWGKIDALSNAIESHRRLAAAESDAMRHDLERSVANHVADLNDKSETKAIPRLTDGDECVRRGPEKAEWASVTPEFAAEAIAELETAKRAAMYGEQVERVSSTTDKPLPDTSRVDALSTKLQGTDIHYWWHSYESLARDLARELEQHRHALNAAGEAIEHLESLVEGTAKSSSDPLKCRTCRSSLVQTTVDKCDSGEACPFYRYRSADRGAKS